MVFQFILGSGIKRGVKKLSRRQLQNIGKRNQNFTKKFLKNSNPSKTSGVIRNSAYAAGGAGALGIAGASLTAVGTRAAVAGGLGGLAFGAGNSLGKGGADVVKDQANIFRYLPVILIVGATGFVAYQVVKK